MPETEQAAALLATLRAVNEAANRVSAVAFEQGVPREYELRKHTYADLKSRGLGAQSAQHHQEGPRRLHDAQGQHQGRKPRQTGLEAAQEGRVQAHRLSARGSPAVRRPVPELAVRRADGVHLDHRRTRPGCTVRLLRRRPQDAARAPAGRIGPGGTRRRVLPDRHLRGPRGEAVRARWVHWRRPRHRQHRHHVHRLPGRRARPEPAPQTPPRSTREAPAQGHQVRQAAPEEANRARSACLQHQPRHRENDRDRG